MKKPDWRIWVKDKKNIEEIIINKLKSNKKMLQGEIIELVHQKESDILEFKQKTKNLTAHLKKIL